MVKKGILNANLAGELTKLRHLDKVLICDGGFPIPIGANTVDVSLVEGLPTMLQVLQALLDAMIFEEYTIYDNLKDVNPAYYEVITSSLQPLKSSELDMGTFLQSLDGIKLYIRTGDLLPCSNILLVSASGVHGFCEKFDVTLKV